MILNYRAVFSGLLELVAANTTIASAIDGEYDLVVNYFGTWRIQVLKCGNSLHLTHIGEVECSTSTQKHAVSAGQ